MTVTRFFLSAGGHELRTAAAGRDGPVGVLVCQALADEGYHSREQVEDLLRGCDRRGIPAVSVDPFGCGESEGRFEDARSSDWIGGLEAAAVFLREHRCVGRIVTVGIRFGCVLALHLLGTLPGAAGAVLWEPVTNVKRHLRLMRIGPRIGALRRAPGDGAPAVGGSEVPAGGAKAGAYLFQPALVEDLERLSGGLADIRDGMRHPLLVVAVGRTDTTRDFRRLADEFSGWNVVLRHLRREPFWESIDYEPSRELTDTSISWIGKNAGVPDTAEAIDAGRLPTPRREIVRMRDGTRERIIQLHGGSIATLHLPDGVARDTAVLIHPGARGNPTGPGRLLVNAARRFAKRGFVTLRYGSSQYGDANGPAGDVDSLTRLADSLRAADALCAQSEKRRLCLVGLCRGAEDALIFAELCVRSIISHRCHCLILWSVLPAVRFLTREQQVRAFLDKLRPYIAKLGRRETWLKMIRGRLDTDGIAAGLRVSRESPPGKLRVPAHLADMVDPRDLRKAVGEMDKANTRLLDGYGGGLLIVAPELDSHAVGGISYLRSRIHAEGMRFRGIVLPGGNHNFADPDQADWLLETSIDWLGEGER